jgi:PTS system mannose-specific IID component
VRPERLAFLRLLTVQASWNYERMSGLGVGYAAEPLLRDLERSDPQRHADALHRAGGFFNSHPYFAGVAVGAEARAEYDGTPGGQIERLRAALCSPLGALGDQLIWAGLWPAVIGAALVGVRLFHAWWIPLAAVALMTLVRVWVTRWSLRTGLRSGMRVGGALQATRLRRWVTPLGVAAGAAVGAAVPLVVHLGVRTAPEVVVASATALVGLLTVGPRTMKVNGVQFGVAMLAVALLALAVAG